MIRELGRRLLLVVAGVIVALGTIELLLRTLSPSAEHYYVWPPLFRQTVRPLPEYISGVSGPSEIRINSRGLRADELTPEFDFTILTIGGSTTESFALDQSKTWPNLVQTVLNESQRRRVWVGNAGRSGHGTREHIYQVHRLLEVLPGTNLLVLLVGVNDLGLRLQQDDDYDPDFLLRDGVEDRQIVRAFSVYPLRYRDGLPIYKRLEIYGRARTIRTLLVARVFRWWQLQDNAGETLQLWRQNRRNATAILAELPDLQTALEEYGNNLERIIDIARSRGVDVLFLSQPTLWRADLPAPARELLYWGGKGEFQAVGARVDYYSVGALARGMEAYNQTLLRVCQRRRVDCLDLARALAKDTENFYDDMHFTEQGSARVAAIVAAHVRDRLLQAAPQGASGRHSDAAALK